MKGAHVFETKFLKLSDAAAMLRIDEDNLLLAAAENKIKAWGLLNEHRYGKRYIVDLYSVETPDIVEQRTWHPMFVPMSKFAAGDVLKYGQGKVSLLTEEDNHGTVWSDDEETPAYIPRNAIFFLRADIKSLLVNEQQKDAPANLEKPLSTTERNSLLTIIAALCEYSAIKYQDRGAASQIAKLTEQIGASVSPETVKRALEKIPDALAARMK